MTRRTKDAADPSDFARCVREELAALRHRTPAPVESPPHGHALLAEALEDFRAEVFRPRGERSQGEMVCRLVALAALCRRVAADVCGLT